MPEWWYMAVQVLLGACFATRGVAGAVSAVRGVRDRRARRLMLLSPTMCDQGCLALFGAAVLALGAVHLSGVTAVPWGIAATGLGAALVGALLGVRVPHLDVWTLGRGPNGLQFANSNYRVCVAPDGCLTQLVVGRESFVLSRPGIPHGARFFQRVPLELESVEQPAKNVIVASGNAAVARYEFGPDRMTWTLTNRTRHNLSFVLPFDHAVHTVMDDEGRLYKPPIERTCAVSTWFAGMSSLRITGSTRLWGPWSDGRQVWTVDLTPGETREVLVEVNAASDVDVARAMGWWRVFGRRSAGAAPSNRMPGH